MVTMQALGRHLGFYSKCNGDPLKYFKQKRNYSIYFKASLGSSMGMDFRGMK